MNLLADRLGSEEEETAMAEVALEWVPFAPQAITVGDFQVRLGRQAALTIHTLNRLLKKGLVAENDCDRATFTRVRA
jgi:hypothetical protein